MPQFYSYWPARAAALLLGLALLPAWAGAQNVGINTTQPTQTLDVNGGLRVRGLSGTGDNRLLNVQPDGTFSLSPPLYAAQATSAVPGLLGTATDLKNARQAVVRGNKLYLVSSTTDGGLVNANENYLQIYDVSNPGQPVLQSTTPTQTHSNFLALNAAGTLAYVMSRNSASGGLRTYDVSDPTAPVLLGTRAVGNIINGLAVHGTKAYIGGSSGLRILDVSNPASTSNTPLGSVALGSQGRIVLDPTGTFAYVFTEANGLRVVNVSNPAAPVIAGTLSGLGTTDIDQDIYLVGTKLYVLSSINSVSTLSVIDVATPANPVLLGSYATDAAGLTTPRALLVAGQTGYLTSTNKLVTLNVSNPAAISFVGEVYSESTNLVTGAHCLAMRGSSLFVGLGLDPLPAAPNQARGELREYQLAQAGPPRLVSVNADGTLASLPAPTLSLSGTTLSLSGGNSVTLPGGDNLGNGVATTAVRLPDQDLLLRAGAGTDDGLGYYGASPRLWVSGQNIDGPVLFGRGGGALGTRTGSTAATALRWTATGNVGLGLGSTAPAVRLDVNGALALRPAATIALTANNQSVAPGNASYLRLTSNENTPAQRVVVLASGTAPGQVLLLENAGATGSFSLLDTTTVDLTGTVILGPADVLQLMWTGTKWVQLSFSNN